MKMEEKIEEALFSFQGKPLALPTFRVWNAIGST